MTTQPAHTNTHRSKSISIANQDLRNAIAKQTEQFLSKGGHIAKLTMGETGIDSIKRRKSDTN